MSRPRLVSVDGQPARKARALVLLYAVFASFWIAFSDQLAGWLFPDPTRLTLVGTIKGWAFVAVTSGLLYVLIRRQLQTTFEALKHQDAALALAQTTENTLRNSEQQYRALFENSMDAILLTDLDGRVVAANAQAARLFGCSVPDLLQLERHQLADPTDPRLRAAMAERERTGRFAGELTFIRPGQGKFPVEVLSQVFMGANNRPMSCMVVRDLTQRVHAKAMADLRSLRSDALLSLSEVAESMTERGFMQHGMELAEQLTGSKISFIHLVHEDQETIELVAWSSATLAHYCTASYDSHYPVSQAGIWADALRQRTAVVVNDYENASGKHGLPQGHAQLLRLISVPVMDQSLVRLMAGVGNKATPYTDTDVETVRLLADAIWRIVQKRRTEAALRASESFNRSILNSVSSEIAVLDSAGTIVAVNEPWRRFAIDNSLLPGVIAPGTQLGANYLAACQPVGEQSSEYALKVDAGIRAVLAGQLPGFQLEYPCHAPQVQRWFSLRVTPLDSGPQNGVVVVHTDISERKLQQRQLQLAEQIFAQAQEGIIVTDASDTIIMVNAAFSQITGYPAAQAIGQSPRLLQSGRHDGAFYRAMWDALGSVGRWSGEIWNKRKDGTIYPEWLAIAALRDGQGQLTHYVASFSDLSQSKEAEGRIQWLTHFDPLTGLPNRALLQDRTALALHMAQRAGEPLALLLVALDHFAAINESLGHQAGDKVLNGVAHRLSDAVREQDTVARLGGKEFVLMLPGTDSVGAAHLAGELLGKLAQPFVFDDQEISVTASIGIASFPDNGQDFDALFKAVEIAMRRAQSNGRNTYQFYSENLFEQALAREAMVRALRNAIALDQLQLVYQPQVDLRNGSICGLEALLRWTHPQLGAVAPAEFIPLAEEAGVIVAMGEWVLQQSCHDIRDWIDLGLTVPHVAVNVSTRQLRDNDLVAQVGHAVQQAQIDPSLLYLEVTETAMMDDVVRNEAMLRALKELGVKLSLDDFGTGYSSLSYLKRFPFDQVKIDRSFVRDVASSSSAMMLVKVIILMAHGLGMKAIAEGVETEAQCEVMRNNLCDEIQGYFFSEPVMPTEVAALLTQDRHLPEHLQLAKAPQRTLLLVDDEPNIVSALKRLFRRDGHKLLTANSGDEGLKVLAQHRVDIILSDQRMPGMTGVEFLRTAKALYPDTIRIVLSGYTELQSVTDAINEGAVYRFLTKPWDDDALRDQINQAIAHRQIVEENRQLASQLQDSNRELIAANRQLQDALQQCQIGNTTR